MSRCDLRLCLRRLRPTVSACAACAAGAYESPASSAPAASPVPTSLSRRHPPASPARPAPTPSPPWPSASACVVSPGGTYPDQLSCAICRRRRLRIRRRLLALPNWRLPARRRRLRGVRFRKRPGPGPDHLSGLFRATRVSRANLAYPARNLQAPPVQPVKGGREGEIE